MTTESPGPRPRGSPGSGGRCRGCCPEAAVDTGSTWHVRGPRRGFPRALSKEEDQGVTGGPYPVAPIEEVRLTVPSASSYTEEGRPAGHTPHPVADAPDRRDAPGYVDCDPPRRRPRHERWSGETHTRRHPKMWPVDLDLHFDHELPLPRRRRLPGLLRPTGGGLTRCTGGPDRPRPTAAGS